MLTKRIIPCLDIKDGRIVKGVNFVQLRDAGEPVEVGARYAEQGADELVFLDITATIDKRKTLAALVKEISARLNIPFTVGGGVTSIADVSVLLEAGADKIAVNSAAVNRPELINELAQEFGNQCIVVAIDTKDQAGEHIVHVHGGRTPTERRTMEWAKELQERGAGEILLTSMDHDGTKAGFALELTGTLSRSLDIPVIASGGAGNREHFSELFAADAADAALAASIFHFGEVKIPELKQYLSGRGVPIRL